jgi:hypothetical protein
MLGYVLEDLPVDLSSLLFRVQLPTSMVVSADNEAKASRLLNCGAERARLTARPAY